MNFPFQRMRDPAFPESGAQAFESISKYVLCCGDVLHGGLWRFRTGYLAFTTLHGHYDLCGSHSVTNTGAYIHYIFIKINRLKDILQVSYIIYINFNIF